MTGAQPNPIHEQVAETKHAAETEYGNDTGFADQAEIPEYAGDMPDDPEQAKHFRPGQDEQRQAE